MTVIKMRAETAARKTVRRACLMAMMAAMKKVLSPISETTMTVSDDTKPWTNPDHVKSVKESMSMLTITVTTTSRNNDFLMVIAGVLFLLFGWF